MISGSPASSIPISARIGMAEDRTLRTSPARDANIRSDMTAGELLRTVRRRHGLSQAQLAARARTSQAAISRIERGLVSPSIATLATLLDLMGEELVLDAEA